MPYLNANCHEKIFAVGRKEFGSDEGCVIIVQKALYELKSAGVAWRALFAESIVVMGFKSTRADPDVYICPQVKPNGFKYYEMLLVLVDDILCLSHAPKPIMDEIGKLYRVKEESLGVPNCYLGANVEKFQLPDRRDCLLMSSCEYVVYAVKNLEKTLSDEGSKLCSKADGPFPLNYRPESDVSKELKAHLI